MSGNARNFAYLRGVDDYRYGIAIAEASASFRVIPEPCTGPVRAWIPIRLRLDFGQFENNLRGFPDLLVTNICREVMSVRLRSIMDSVRGANDSFQWLPMLVSDEFGTEVREYSFLHFPDAPEILDESRSIYVGEGESRSLFLPAFRSDALSCHEVCTFRGATHNSDPIVSPSAQDAIQSAGCTALRFVVLEAVDG